jgi:hypothetical protein
MNSTPKSLNLHIKSKKFTKKTTRLNKKPPTPQKHYKAKSKKKTSKNRKNEPKNYMPINSRHTEPKDSDLFFNTINQDSTLYSEFGSVIQGYVHKDFEWIYSTRKNIKKYGATVSPSNKDTSLHVYTPEFSAPRSNHIFSNSASDSYCYQKMDTFDS